MAKAPVTKTEARQQRLLDLLPDYDWSVTKAGIAAGYSKAYATTTLARQVRKNAKLCKAIIEKRETMAATTEDLRDKVQRRLMRVVDSTSAADRDAIKAAEVVGKMNGWMSETIRMESSERQQQLDASHAAAARQIAAVLLDTRRLPGDTIPPVTAQNTSIVPSSSPVGGTSEVIDADFVPSTPSNVLSNADARQDQSQVKADVEPAAGGLNADAGTAADACQGEPEAAAGADAGDGRGPAGGGSMPPMPGGASTLITYSEISQKIGGVSPENFPGPVDQRG